jgi:hypothetical protein
MIEFIGSDTRLVPDPLVRIGECTPSNPSGRPQISSPQLMSFDNNSRMTDQSIELQMWLGLPGSIGLGLIPIVLGPAITLLIGPATTKTIKVLTVVATPIIAAYTVSSKSSQKQASNEASKEASAKEYREKLEKVIEKQEIDDRKAGRPTMQA